MPVPLPILNTAGLIAGQSVISDWTNHVWPQTLVQKNIWAPENEDQVPHLQIFNESGAGFQVFMSSGQPYTFIPAGAWLQIPIDPSEIKLTFTASYVLPGTTPNLLILIYYAPGEKMPPVQVIGNSPIQVGSNLVVESPAVTIEQDLLTPFVLSGILPTADGSVPNQVDVQAGIALLRQTDGGLLRQGLTAATFLTSVPSTTYFLDLNPDASYSFGTSHSTQSNYMPIAQVTTNVSGNITAVTDMRPASTTLLAGYTGTVNAPGTFGIPQGLFFDNALTPNDFGEINLANLGFLDIGVTALSPSTDNPTILFILTKGASTFLPLAIGTPGLEPVGSYFDTAGALHTNQPPILIAGNQETGAVGMRFIAAAAGNVIGCMVNFKTHLQNIPTSITLTVNTQSNVSSAVVGIITRDGFQFTITATAAGAAFWLGAYTTVGN